MVVVVVLMVLVVVLVLQVPRWCTKLEVWMYLPRVVTLRYLFKAC